MTNADDLSLGEKLYCVLEDVKDYIQRNNLEQDKELDWIENQLEDIKEILER